MGNNDDNIFDNDKVTRQERLFVPGRREALCCPEEANGT